MANIIVPVAPVFGLDAVLLSQDETVIETSELLEETERPFMTTPFEEYTVSEGLLLVLALSVFIASLVKIFRGIF